MPRLLLVVNDPLDFLASRQVLAEAARTDGWDVHVAAPDEPAGAVIAAAWPFHPVAIDRTGMHPWREARAAVAITGLLRRLAPAVVHLRATKPILAGGLAAWTRPQTGIVSHVCGLAQLGRPGWRATGLRYALAPAMRLALSLPRQTVVVQNPDDAAVIGRLSSHHPMIIPGSGVDCTLFAPTPMPAMPFTAVLPARLLRSKGIECFATAGRILHQRGIAVRMAVVGGVANGNRDALPEHDIATWVANGDIEWWGERHDMPAVYAACHTVVLPSTFGEGLPRALLEGAACARPLITSDWPGCRSAVMHGTSGFLVAPGDAGALADAIARIAADMTLAKRMGEAARQRALREFATPRIIAAFLDLYRQLA